MEAQRARAPPRQFWQGPPSLSFIPLKTIRAGRVRFALRALKYDFPHLRKLIRIRSVTANGKHYDGREVRAAQFIAESHRSFRSANLDEIQP